MHKKIPSCCESEDGDDSMMYIYRSYITTKTGQRIYPKAYGMKALKGNKKYQNL